MISVIISAKNIDVIERMGNWKVVYQIFIIVWIIFGLGFLFMIITLIADGLKKPAKSATKKFKQAQKVMFTRVLQEILVMRNKEVRVMMI